jgi:ABC-type antimicrobial peptide transport system permease subunit
MHALRRNIMRSVLTCLGIIIGIAAVIAMMEIGQGSSYTIEQTLSKMGVNVVQVEPDSSNIGGVSTGAGGRATLTPGDAEAISRECDSVLWAAPSVDCHSLLVYRDRTWWPHQAIGSTPEYLEIRGWNEMAQGEMFTDADVVSQARVCVLGQTIATELFHDESPIGKEIRMRNVRLRVVGVLTPKGASMSGQDQDNFMIAPWTTVKYFLSGSRESVGGSSSSSSTTDTLSQIYPTQSVALYPAPSATETQDQPQIVRFDDLDDIWFSAKSPDALPRAMAQVDALLRDRHQIEAGLPPDFKIRNLTEIFESFASTSKLMTRLLLFVALISLIVGGVGIMNIMLVSVTERTREIGLRMAVGARARDILRQFLVEAVLLCLAGGITGVLLGRGVSVAIRTFLQWPTRPSIPAIIAAVATSATVGMIFGYYPAWKASRLDPIEALRYE